MHLQTTKKGKNTGRWFYICQEPKEKQCGFFLWADLAQVREKGALLAGTRSEADPRGDAPAAPEAGPSAAAPTTPERPRPKQRIFKGIPEYFSPRSGAKAKGKAAAVSDSDSSSDSEDGRGDMDLDSIRERDRRKDALNTPPAAPGTGAGSASTAPSATLTPGTLPSSYTLPRQVSPTPNPRKRALASDTDASSDNDSDSYGDVDSETERALAALADDSAARAARPEPKSLSQDLQAAAAATPAAARTAVGPGGLPTPLTRDGGDEPARKRVRFDDTVAVEATPTPARGRDVFAAPSATLASPLAAAGGQAEDDGADGDDYPVTRTVLGLLSPARAAIPDDVLAEVRAELNAFALRAAGIKRGRDMVRAALGARDVRVAELQARVVELENGRRMAREIRRGRERDPLREL